MALGSAIQIRYRFSLRTLMLLVVLVAFFLVSWRPLAIAYHRYRMLQAQESLDTASDLVHTRAMAQLGFYEERRFVFKHLNAGSPESRALLSQLRDVAGDSPLADGPTALMAGHSPGEEDAITVWAKADQMSTVVSIVESYDIPPQ